MSPETITVQALAAEASACFEIARRATGDTATGPREDGEEYTRVRDGSPEWVTDLVREAHGEFLLDDWRYACIASACEAIADSDDPDDARGEWADSYVDVYNHELHAWLSSNLQQRAGYVDEGVENFGHSDRGVDGDIAIGQYTEAEEVYGLVLQFLESRLEEVVD